MPSIDKLRPQPDDRLAFFHGFLKKPGQVGSIIPSSRFLERRIVRAAGIQRARLVVELGPGTGGTTRRRQLAFVSRRSAAGSLSVTCTVAGRVAAAAPL